MIFKPTLQSCIAKKQKALGIFEKTRVKLNAAINEFQSVISNAQAEVEKYTTMAHDARVEAELAHVEIKLAQDTITKINGIVGV